METQPITIRRAEPADAAALARLRYRFRSELGAAIEAEAIFVARATAWLAEHLATPSWLAWIAADSTGAIGGHSFLQLVAKLPNPVVEAEQIGYITNVYVVPELRGQGLGSRLMQAALASCPASTTDSVILWPSPKSRGLYERLGFREPAHLLELPLGQPRPPHS